MTLFRNKQMADNETGDEITTTSDDVLAKLKLFSQWAGSAYVSDSLQQVILNWDRVTDKWLAEV